MTSRERVLSAFNHTKADRVPIDYMANPGIDHRLKEHFRLSQDDHEGLLKALGVDFRSIYAPYTGPRLHAEIPCMSILYGESTRAGSSILLVDIGITAISRCKMRMKSRSGNGRCLTLKTLTIPGFWKPASSLTIMLCTSIAMEITSTGTGSSATWKPL